MEERREKGRKVAELGYKRGWRKVGRREEMFRERLKGEKEVRGEGGKTRREGVDVRKGCMEACD